MIEYKNGPNIKPFKGEWKADQKKFLHTDQSREKIEWGILNTSSKTQIKDLGVLKRMVILFFISVFFILLTYFYNFNKINKIIGIISVCSRKHEKGIEFS